MVNKTWDAVYSTRQVSAKQAISTIHSFQKVFLAPFCNEPQTLVEELVRQKDRFKNVFLYNMVIGSPCVYADTACHPHFKIRTFLSSPLLKKAFLNDACEYLPVNLSEIPRWIKQEKIDVALIQVSPPNDAGYCNLGISVDFVQTLIKEATYVIAELNSQMPLTNGDTLLHISEIDQFVLSDRPLLSIPSGEPSEEEVAIGKFVAELIPDYSTIQLGVGKIADSILLSLKSKKGLGIHSGSITDPVKELIELGVITNENKEINQYKTVCATITGTEELYEFCHLNESIEIYPTDYTHNAAIISRISNFHSVNSALEVDIFGQVNAEQIGDFTMAGVGGQMDFIRGARLSKGGKAIIALPSTVKKGTQSRIKTKISYVTSLKSEIDYVVTEFGVASLFGKSLRERAKALIKIAHPNFREQLLAEYEESFPVNV
ncbi:acetyl-CoA hydrolase/transferase family protein [Peribacillus sp. NPDC060253]|uniref:acetyl-CoA hydrolase/transferase family protein n=1 Tax=Peribacillus sp. NPDC060253 TaxID=3347084 RepID=UPI003655A266